MKRLTEESESLFHIAYGLDAFNRMRLRGKSLSDSFFARLASATRIDSEVPSEDPSDSPPTESTDSSGSGGLRGWIRKWSNYKAQYRELGQLHRSEKVLAVALASRRLHSIAVSSPREYLKALSAGLHASDIQRRLSEATQILIFEPSLESDFWEHRNACRRESVFIIDTGFLLYALLKAPVAASVAALRLLTVRKKIFVSWPSLELKTLFAATMLSCAYRLLLSDFKHSEAIFFTSNAHATEVLRVHLLRDSRCTKITEILHGVPTVEVEDYFTEILKLDSSDKLLRKHDFVEQVPGLILAGVIGERKQPEVSINAYLNRYLGQNPALFTDRTAFIREELDKLGVATGDIVLTFGGGMAVYRRSYFGSIAFRAECQLMLWMMNELARKRVSFRIVYAVHPLHLPSELRRCTFFKEHNIAVCGNTVFTWLISDYFVSLLSSSMFEAAYFGAKVFSPVIPSDAYYSTHLLDRLSHPQTDGPDALLDAVSDYLRGSAPSNDILHKAAARLDRLLPPEMLHANLLAGARR